MGLTWLTGDELVRAGNAENGRTIAIDDVTGIVRG
jgi:hypothetical protein